MTTSAAIGWGSTYEIFDSDGSPNEYITLGEVTSIDPGADETDLIDATHMASPNRRREFVAGLIDGGEGTVELNFVPGSVTHVLCRTLQANGTSSNHRITYPNGQRVTFPGIVRSISTPAPVDDKMVMTIGVKVAGDATWDTAS